jgi:hypothetical protein
MAKREDLTGKTVGNFTALESFRIEGNRCTQWKCRCNLCEDIHNLPKATFLAGATYSCGCVRPPLTPKAVKYNKMRNITRKNNLNLLYGDE